MHVATAGESVTQPLKYYTSVASNTINVLEAMKAAGVQEVRCPILRPAAPVCHCAQLHYHL